MRVYDWNVAQGSNEARERPKIVGGVLVSPGKATRAKKDVGRQVQRSASTLPGHGKGQSRKRPIPEMSTTKATNTEGRVQLGKGCLEGRQKNSRQCFSPGSF